MTADWIVIFADLIIDGEHKGPHPFLTRMRDEHGALMPGIHATSMGEKTVANDLDNALIRLDAVRVPRSGLLARFVEMRGNAYTQIGDEPMRIERSASERGAA